MYKIMNDEKYIKATTKNLYLNRPFKSMEKYTDKPVNQQTVDYFKDMGLLKEYIKANPSDNSSVIKKSKKKK